MPGALTIRKAHEDDLSRLLDIHLGAYPDPRGPESRQRNFEANGFGGLDDLYVVVRGERILGHAFLYAMQSWFGGRAVRVGGIGSVGVAAEARGQGIARALLEHLHAVSLARGDAITLLYAYRHGFYRRLGYSPATPMYQLEVAPSAVPASWIAASRGAVRSLEPSDPEQFVRTYERVAMRSTGWLARRPLLWERRLLDNRRAWFITEDGRGYVSWTLDKSEYHVATRLIVHDLVADDDATWRILWGHLGAQKDQIHCIEIGVVQDDPAVFALVDIDAHRYGSERVEHPFGVLHSGPMVRVHDIASALEARGYLTSGTLVIGVGDARASQIDADAAYRLEVEGGTARVTACRISVDAPVDLLFSDAAGLASVAYGAVRLSQAARTGLVTARDRHTLERAEHLFAMPAFDALDPF